MNKAVVLIALLLLGFGGALMYLREAQPAAKGSNPTPAQGSASSVQEGAMAAESTPSVEQNQSSTATAATTQLPVTPGASIVMEPSPAVAASTATVAATQSISAPAAASASIPIRDQLQLAIDCETAPRNVAELEAGLMNFDRARHAWSSRVQARFSESDAALNALMEECRNVKARPVEELRASAAGAPLDELTPEQRAFLDPIGELQKGNPYAIQIAARKGVVDFGQVGGEPGVVALAQYLALKQINFVLSPVDLQSAHILERILAQDMLKRAVQDASLLAVKAKAYR